MGNVSDYIRMDRPTNPVRHHMPFRGYHDPVSSFLFIIIFSFYMVILSVFFWVFGSLFVFQLLVCLML